MLLTSARVHFQLQDGLAVAWSSAACCIRPPQRCSCTKFEKWKAICQRTLLRVPTEQKWISASLHLTFLPKLKALSCDTRWVVPEIFLYFFLLLSYPTIFFYSFFLSVLYISFHTFIYYSIVPFLLISIYSSLYHSIIVFSFLPSFIPSFLPSSLPPFLLSIHGKVVAVLPS